MLAALAILLLTPTASADTPDERPNILLIVTDDQSTESLSCYGSTVCRTPHLDRLAAEGMILTDAHHMGAWAGAVCLPSRTMIMTGRTVWHLPGRSRKTRAAKAARSEPSNLMAFGNRNPPAPGITAKEAADSSLPQVFRDANYATFRTCKIGNSFAAANARFEVVRDQSSRGNRPGNSSVWHADQALQWFEDRESRDDPRPFLAYVGFSHPHDPRMATPEKLADYGVSNEGPSGVDLDRAPPLPDNWLPKHPFPHGHPGLRDEVKVQGVGVDRDPATVRNELGREYGCIELIDEQIGRLVDHLRTTGQLENTYVVFTSDHGIAIGRHGLMGKQNLYEHTWRVPLIVQGPGIEAGSSASGFVYLLDLLPTLCELAGIQTPATSEGQSFVPVLRGQSERIREVVYGVYCGGSKPGIRAVKTVGWKLVEWDVLDGTVRRSQLFDLEANPNEYLSQHANPEVVRLTGVTPSDAQRNLAEEPGSSERLSMMRQLLDEQMKHFDDPYELAQP